MTYLPILAAAVGVLSDGTITSDLAQVALAQPITESASLLCVRIKEGDPSPSLLRKLQRRDRVILAGSQCHEWTDANHPDYEIRTGRNVHFMVLSDAAWSSGTQVSVRAEERRNGNTVKVWTVHLAWGSSGWQILSVNRDPDT